MLEIIAFNKETLSILEEKKNERKRHTKTASGV
jgi:hypothetical protein